MVVWYLRNRYRVAISDIRICMWDMRYRYGPTCESGRYEGYVQFVPTKRSETGVFGQDLTLEIE